MGTISANAETSVIVVDPFLEAAGLASQEVGLLQRIRENGAALVADKQLDRQVVRITSPHGPKLLFDPVQLNLHERGGGGIRAFRLLGHLRAQRSMRATVLSCRIGMLGEEANQCLEPSLRTSMTALQVGER